MPYVTMPANVSSQPQPQSPSLPTPAPTRPRPPSGLATTALIVGIIGFFTGLAPMWGIIIGLTAVLLGQIALRKGQSRGRAMAGIILGSVAALASLITTIVVVVGLTQSPFAVNESNWGSSGPSFAVPETQPETAEPGMGTFENPEPAGTKVISADWIVTINSYNPAADTAVEDGSHNNPSAPEGSHYEKVGYTIEYLGTATAFASDVGISLVTSSNVDVQYAFVILDDRIPYTEFHGPGSATGSLAFVIPDGESVIIRVSPGVYSKESFIAPW